MRAWIFLWLAKVQHEFDVWLLHRAIEWAINAQSAQNKGINCPVKYLIGQFIGQFIYPILDI